MYGLHCGVKAHGPAPEKCSTLGGRSAVDNLLNFAFTTKATYRQNGGAVHGKKQDRSIQKGNREHVERVVEQVAIAQREGRRPVKVREDAKGHSLAPAAHKHRAEETQNQVKPDGSGKGPGHMRAHFQLHRTAIHTYPPKQNRQGNKEAREQPPSALI